MSYPEFVESMNAFSGKDWAHVDAKYIDEYWVMQNARQDIAWSIARQKGWDRV